ncbi:MAG: four-carbon acid sugar kinase family protein [Atopobiaceae bacterium]
MQMAMIADDLTGALDAGVCMLPSDVAVATSSEQAEGLLQDKSLSVLSVNAGTRHLDAEAAYAEVAKLVRLAKKAGCRSIFKKTDSVLRGNVGAELAAAFDASGASRLHFLPAFPAMGRTTKDGIQYVNGTPVAESAFGKDPFEPVRESSVASIIAEETEVPVKLVREGEPVPQDFKGICVYDAATNEAMSERVAELASLGELGAIAGCAGLAQALHVLEHDGKGAPKADFEGNLLVVCGSVNPASRAQCRYAEGAGARMFPIAEQQKCSSAWPETPEGRDFISKVSKSWHETPLTVVDGSGLEDLAPLFPEGTDIRQTVADNVAGLLLAVCRKGIFGRALVMGGDILSSFLSQANVSAIYPKGEAAQGIVVLEIDIAGQRFSLASKSGGFGTKDLFVTLAQSARLSEGVAQ